MEEGGELPSGFPGLPAPAPARPVVSGKRAPRRRRRVGGSPRRKAGSPAICQNGRPRRPDQWRIQSVAVSSALCGWVRRSSRPTGSWPPTADRRVTAGSSRSWAPTRPGAPRRPSPTPSSTSTTPRPSSGWSTGRQPTERVERILKTSGAWDEFAAARANDRPLRSRRHQPVRGAPTTTSTSRRSTMTSTTRSARATRSATRTAAPRWPC